MGLQEDERRKMRQQWEQDLWVLPPDGNWTVLAEEVMRHTAGSTSEYEKVCFVENRGTRFFWAFALSYLRFLVTRHCETYIV